MDFKYNLNYFERLYPSIIRSSFEFFEDCAVKLLKDEVYAAALPENLNQIHYMVVLQLFEDSYFS